MQNFSFISLLRLNSTVFIYRHSCANPSTPAFPFFTSITCASKVRDNIEQNFENDFRKSSEFANDNNIGHKERIEAAVVLMAIKNLLQSLAVVADIIQTDDFFKEYEICTR
ncbi:hypothetical protein [Desulfovibrio sp. UCD-KL4C]|uniref:hypothetical protein n=1 Tax=Desulfovibrio sp. UCD-KL4C TaxID=2578120 RepID=UPI0025BB7183|nr:hypothetical protein [Desulfovibrio sp. UCD-KL4C]